MKALIDNATNTVIGAYAFPLSFSMSGKASIEIPDDFGVTLADNVVANAISQKISGFESLHPTFTQTDWDELFDLTKVDLTLSSRIVAGPEKRTYILPGGVLMTNSFVINVPTLTALCTHWDGYTVYVDPGDPTETKPPPSRILHDFDPLLPGFSVFNPSTLTVMLKDITGGVTLIPSLPFDTEYPYVSATPLTVRLSFTNNGAVPVYLSGWILLS